MLSIHCSFIWECSQSVWECRCPTRVGHGYVKLRRVSVLLRQKAIRHWFVSVALEPVSLHFFSFVKWDLNLYLSFLLGTKHLVGTYNIHKHVITLFRRNNTIIYMENHSWQQGENPWSCENWYIQYIKKRWITWVHPQHSISLSLC